MYARVASIEGPTDGLVDAIESNVIPVLQHLDGFHGGYWTTRPGGHAISITFFESPQVLATSRATADRLRQQLAADQGLKIDFAEYEVIESSGMKVHRDAAVMRVAEVVAEAGNLERGREVISRAIPQLSLIDGFDGGVWLADSNRSHGMSLILFNSQERLDAGSDQLNVVRENILAAIEGKTRSVDDYDIVTRSEVPQPAQH